MTKKLLIAFDFDHTIIDGNSDTIVRQLIHTQPPECKHSESWTRYMQQIFNLLHEQGIGQMTYQETIAGIPPSPDMIDLLQFLNSPDIEVIIISDSNSVFIETWLEAHKMAETVKKVYTNKASFDSEGLLNVSMYHSQNWCTMCPENLCKGSVLDEHLKSRHKDGEKFSYVAYVGDGKNDYCPFTKLSGADYVFPRKGYYLEKLLASKAKEDNDKKESLANICVWSSASEIKQKLSEIV